MSSSASTETSGNGADNFKPRAKLNIPWMKARFLWALVSAILVIGSAAIIASKGLNLGVDFVGGSVTEIEVKNADVPDVRQTLGASPLQGVTAQKFGEKSILVQIRAQDAIPADQATDSVKALLKKAYGDKLTIRRTETVGPKVGDELVRSGALTILIAVAAMLFYIWIRFELPFAVGSVLALFHDVIITIGFFSFFQFEFGLPIIAALLTIIGYSMNDTVVIFDRVRENLGLYRKSKITDIINLSVNETMSRTLVTSGTTLLALTALLIFGGDILRPFIIAMTFGIFIGTYSSIFIACPFLTVIGVKNNFSKNKGKKKKPTADEFFGLS